MVGDEPRDLSGRSHAAVERGADHDLQDALVAMGVGIADKQSVGGVRQMRDRRYFLGFGFGGPFGSSPGKATFGQGCHPAVLFFLTS